MGSVVEQFRADLASWLISLGAGKLSHEFFNLVNNIGSARSKQEEAAIIKREVELLQQTINKPENTKHMREFLIRGLYCEMLGYPVPFVYIHALNMTQSTRLLDKRVGYLCTSIFLNEDHELLLLLLNSVRKDLDSTNILEAASAMACMAWLLNKDTVSAILPLIVDKTKSTHELVRKKAVMLLLRCLQKDVASTWPQIENVLRARLCDTDPSVMAATLHAFRYVIDLKHSDPVAYSYLPTLVDLVPSFVGILKQIVDKRLPSHYTYHTVQAPWIQVTLLRILRILGLIEPSCVTHMATVLKSILTAPADRMASCAVVNEAIHTVCALPVERALLDLSARNISLFLGATSQDLNYLGLTLLAKIVTINPIYAAEHQAHVISCLESPDDSIRTKTIQLLFNMTNVKNLAIIVEKMLDRLRRSTDVYLRTDLVAKITTLAEKYSADNYWFITTMNEVFLAAGDNLPTDVAHKFLRFISEGATDDDETNVDLRIHAVHSFLQLSLQPQLSDSLQMVMAWILGEYGYLSENPAEVVNALADLLERPPNLKQASNIQRAANYVAGSGNTTSTQSSESFAVYYGSEVKQWVVAALTKLAASVGLFPSHVRELFTTLIGSDNLELSRRCLEALTILDHTSSDTNRKTLHEVFPIDAASEDLVPSEILENSLDAYVQRALAAGARPYARPMDKASLLMTRTPKEEKQLRWKAYERPVEPPRQPIMTLPPGSPTPPSAARYNPLMTTVPGAPNVGGPSAPVAAGGPQAPASPLSTVVPLAGLASLSNMGGRGGPWSSGGFGARPANPLATTGGSITQPRMEDPTLTGPPAHAMATLPPHAMTSIADITATNRPSEPDTYRPRMDPNQARLANALFSGVADSSPTSTNVLATTGAGSAKRRTGSPMARPSSSGSLSSPVATTTPAQSTAQPQPSHLTTTISNLIDMPSTSELDILSGASPLPPSTSSPVLDLLSLDAALPPSSPVLSSSAPFSSSPAPLISQSVEQAAPTSSIPVDLLGDISPAHMSPSTSSSSLRKSPELASDVMAFTDAFASSNPNGGPVRQLSPDRDLWNLSNLSKSPLISTIIEPYPKPSQSSQALCTDQFLAVNVLKAWHPNGVAIALIFGNRTALKITNIKTSLAVTPPLAAHVEADTSVTVSGGQTSRDFVTTCPEIAPHAASITTLQLSIDEKLSLNMSLAGITMFEVHGQPKTVKYRVAVDFQDLVRPEALPVARFGALWNTPMMREVKVRTSSREFGSTSDLATGLTAHQLAMVSVGKAEVVACCHVAVAEGSTPKTLLLIHAKLDAQTVDFTFRSESQTTAEIASRYFESVFV